MRNRFRLKEKRGGGKTLSTWLLNFTGTKEHEETFTIRPLLLNWHLGCVKKTLRKCIIIKTLDSFKSNDTEKVKKHDEYRKVNGLKNRIVK